MLSKGEVKESYKHDREGWRSENVHISEKVKDWVQNKFTDKVLCNVLSVLLYINVWVSF